MTPRWCSPRATPAASAAPSAACSAGRAAAVAGGLKFKEAQTSMLVADCAQRRAGGGGGGQHQGRPTCGLARAVRRRRAPRGGGYGNTNEGKIIAAAFMDNYNKRRGVGPQRPEPAAQRRHAQAGSGGRRHDERPARCSTKATCSAPKIASVKLLASAERHGEGRRDARPRRRARRHRRREERLRQRPGSVGERLGQDHARPEALAGC